MNEVGVIILNVIQSCIVDSYEMEHAYQPMWKLDNWQIFGYEALLRLPNTFQNHNVEQFLDQARQEGHLYEIDSMSILRAIGSFPFDSTNAELLFINIFPSTLLNEQFYQLINHILMYYPLAKGKIVFEINETKDEEHIWENHELKEKISFLRKKNFLIALDDIGRGAASLQKIIEFSPDVIKMDRYFSKELSTSKEKQRMLSLLIEYSNQELTLILEGIEKELDLAIAKSLQVPVGQGYLLGRPEKLNDQSFLRKSHNVFPLAFHV
ncbi:EAL domain-containing protein [Cytobacillus sp. FJAT-53684]|uniref:EAL domain-containing protein n=1 Tax=Cytobacillus mangrovibacter TaxID=3299024 RepID=A0ABW6K455_9BACI